MFVPPSDSPHNTKDWYDMASPDMVGRGVHIAPYLSTSGGMVLVSVTAAGRRVSQQEVPAGDNPADALELMWTELDIADPIPRQPTASLATA